jgi:hypothetical protein
MRVQVNRAAPTRYRSFLQGTRVVRVRRLLLLHPAPSTRWHPIIRVHAVVCIRSNSPGLW